MDRICISLHTVCGLIFNISRIIRSIFGSIANIECMRECVQSPLFRIMSKGLAVLLAVVVVIVDWFECILIEVHIEFKID